MKDAKDPKEKEQKFEESLKELRGIVEKLERGELELDESLKLFERGVGLVKTCSARLEAAQRRVEVALKADKDGARAVRAFPEGEAAEGELFGAGGDPEDEAV